MFARAVVWSDGALSVPVLVHLSSGKLDNGAALLRTVTSALTGVPVEVEWRQQSDACFPYQHTSASLESTNIVISTLLIQLSSVTFSAFYL